MESKPFNSETLDELLRQGIPGFDDAFVDQVMKRLHKIRHSRKHPDLSKEVWAKAKSSMVVTIVKMGPRQPKIPVVEELSILDQVALENELINEKLLEMLQGRLEATQSGQRFVRDLEQQAKTKK